MFVFLACLWAALADGQPIVPRETFVVVPRRLIGRFERDHTSGACRIERRLIGKRLKAKQPSPFELGCLLIVVSAVA